MHVLYCNPNLLLLKELYRKKYLSYHVENLTVKTPDFVNQSDNSIDLTTVVQLYIGISEMLLLKILLI